MANEVEVDIVLNAKKATKAVNDLGKSLEKFTKKFGGQFDNAEAKYDKFGKTVEKSNKKVQNSLKRSDIAVGSFVGNITGGLALRAFSILKNAPLEAFDAFKKFESGLIGVEKTTNLSGKALAKFGDNIKKMSGRLPIATSALLEIAKSAGQLGVRGASNLANFTETIAKLGTVSDVSGESASLALSRILNITGNSTDKIDELASTIVHLGNNYELLESELISISAEVARGTAQFGLTIQEVTALSATLKTLGVRSEEAGGVMTKSFLAIQKSIDDGGKKLTQLSKLTGIAGKDLRTAFENKPMEVFQKLLLGLGKSGSRASQEMEKLGLSGIRVSKVLPTLSQNTDKLKKILSETNTEYRMATALNDEFGKSLKTSESQTILLSNQLDLLKTEIGEKIAPIFDSMSRALGGFVKNLRGVSKERTPQELAEAIQAVNREISELEGTASFDIGDTLRLEEAKAELDALTGSAKSAGASMADLRRRGDTDSTVKPSSGSGGGDVSTELTPAQKAQIAREKTMLAEIGAIRAESQLLEDERQLMLKEQQGIATEEDFEKLNAIEAERVSIRANAELQKTELIKSARERDLAEQKIAIKTSSDLEKLEIKQSLERKRREAEQEKAINQAKISTARNFLSAGIALAKEGSTASKALMIADATIATYVATNKALASPPGPPWSIALATSITAMGLANVAKIAGAKFQQGGVVGGFTGATAGPDNQLAQVRTGEMILNSSQQKNLFDQINSSDITGSNSSVDKLSESISMITSQPIVVEIDGKEIARATRNAQRDGFRIGA